jgi:hypothetical protein
MHISDPRPGNVHDAKAIRETGKLLDWQKEFNTSINKIRFWGRWVERSGSEALCIWCTRR